ncbi:thiomuracin/GE37468 family thiazolyl RiPP peptide [Nonomuraea sp. NPDC050310]|uniref:thiomuracin/GE37468 family thiazolyl RiPP peptide n=1 Tax=unclassified Nonomuraea TaxID=2593643 RepID=UPI0034040363
MSVSKKLDYDLSALPLDVFDLADTGLTVESLTAGHGMPENAASGPCSIGCCSCVA